MLVPTFTKEEWLGDKIVFHESENCRNIWIARNKCTREARLMKESFKPSDVFHELKILGEENGIVSLRLRDESVPDLRRFEYRYYYVPMKEGRT